jgi:hypothetical protein
MWERLSILLDVGRRIYALAAIVVLVMSLTASAIASAEPGSVATAGQRGQVGGPPTIPLGPPDEGKRTTPDLVIGRSDTSTGAVELVAYGWLAPRDSLPASPRRQLCIWVEHLPKEISPGMCGPLLDPNGDQKIVIDDQIRALGKPAQRWTEIGGRLTPDVASVRVSYRRDGRKATGTATVAQVAGELQRKLRQPSPFGYFDLRIRGRVPWHSIRVQAYDSAGAVLGTAGPASSSTAHPRNEQPASGSCRVGAPAPRPTGRMIASLIKLSVPATIIGCGRSAAGALELVAYETRSKEFCFGVLLLRLGSLQGGECKPDNTPWASTCPNLCITSAFGGGWTPLDGFRFTVASGVAPPGLSDIEVIGGRGRRHQRAVAVLGRVEGSLLEKFKQEESFVVLGAVLPVCVSPRTVSALAQGGDGPVKSHGRHLPDLFRHPCHPPPPL